MQPLCEAEGLEAFKRVSGINPCVKMEKEKRHVCRQQGQQWENCCLGRVEHPTVAAHSHCQLDWILSQEACLWGCS